MHRLVLSLALVLVAAPALAAPTPSPSPAASTAPADVHDGGVISGKAVMVDYQRSTIAVDAGGRGRIEVIVMPTTSIQGKDSAYRSITDVKAGQSLEIFSSIAGGKYVAQIIRIR